MPHDNLLINGNFDLWQRGISFAIQYNDPLAGSTTASPNSKLADRWYMIDTQIRAGGSTGNIQAYREAFSSNDRQFALSTYYMTVANNITGVTQGYCYVENKQEDANIIGGVNVTLSFYAKNYSGGVTGATLVAYYRQALEPNTTEIAEELKTFSVNPYWELKTVSFTPKFLANVGLTGEHYFSVGFKIDPQTTISLAAVKLEIGETASTLITDPEEEKQRQAKYYYSSYPLGTLARSITITGGNDLTAINFTTTPNYSYNYKFDIPQYKVPTVTFYSPDTGITSDGYNKTAGKDMRLTSGTRGWNQTTRFSPAGSTTLTTNQTKYGVAFNVSTGAVIFDDILIHMIADADITPGSGDRGLET